MLNPEPNRLMEIHSLCLSEISAVGIFDTSTTDDFAVSGFSSSGFPGWFRVLTETRPGHQPHFEITGG
jgi:hypothetical protein